MRKRSQRTKRRMMKETKKKMRLWKRLVIQMIRITEVDEEGGIEGRNSKRWFELGS